MIVTVTPNPSVDRTASLTGPLERGSVQRVESVTQQSGGKGVNISRAAVAAGLPTVAVLPADPADPFVHDLARAGIDCRPTPASGPIRINLAITEPDGTTTKLNSPGATADADVLAALSQAVLRLAADATWVVLAGSLPPGAPPGWYADLVTALRSSAAQVAVDTSEAPLAALVDALPGAAPDLMKPNGHELASFVGGHGEDLEADPVAAAAAARRLVDLGVRAVLATLGPTGAVLVTAEESWFAPAPEVEVVSTVGAGDSSLFGYLLGDVRRLPPRDRLARAVAYGTAAASLPGTTIPRPDQVQPERVEVHQLPVSPAPDAVPGAR
ncbi:MAG: 1-phosphofructokinase family hexose kinase [Nocardioides sp.]